MLSVKSRSGICIQQIVVVANLSTKIAASKHYFFVQGMSLVAVRLIPLVDLRIMLDFPTVLYHLVFSWSLNIWPSHEASLQSALRTATATVQTLFRSTPSKQFLNM